MARLLAITLFALVAPPTLMAQSPFEARLIERTVQQPGNSSNWRLLGRLRLERGDLTGAKAACEQAIALAPNQASSHFDLARVLFASGERLLAEHHLRQVVALAPESEYARDAAAQLKTLASDAASRPSNLHPVSFEREVAPNRFGGLPQTDLAVTVDDTRAFEFSLEFGAMYNSNVQLAPISRVVSTTSTKSAQGFLSPDLEYRFGQVHQWNMGAKFSGYFSINESHVSQYDLEDYRPGLFVEKTLDTDLGVWLFRIQYDYTLDRFGGVDFGSRHGLAAVASLDRGDAITSIYWSIDHSNFVDDGGTPSIESLDGWTNTLGVSHAFFLEHWCIDLFRGGVDVQYAPLDGADYAYQGVFLFGETETLLPWDVVLNVQLGVGFRDYPDFTGSPSRNETIWRGGVNLERSLNDHWTIAATFAYDRFATDNTLFDSERYLTGLSSTYEY